MATADRGIEERGRKVSLLSLRREGQDRGKERTGGRKVVPPSLRSCPQAQQEAGAGKAPGRRR